MRLISISLFSLGVAAGGVACGDNNDHSDAAVVKMDAPIDGAEPPMGFQDKEAGEVRLEWIQTNLGQNATRATAFFYKSQDPDYFPLPAFPGCVRADRTKWPLGEGTIVPLDVGGVTIHSQTGTDLVMTKDPGPAAPLVANMGGCKTGTLATAPGCDFLGRPHDLWWRKDQIPAGPTNDGDTYLPADEDYEIRLAGSSEWPAQTYKTHMPAAWTINTPPSNMTAHLVPHTAFTTTYTPVTQTNLPPGYSVNFAMAFTATAGYNGPIVLCQLDGTTGTFTVDADTVDYIIATAPGGGKFVRQNLTHHIVELTDGTPRATADRRRLDILSIWCFNSPWLTP